MAMTMRSTAVWSLGLLPLVAWGAPGSGLVMHHVSSCGQCGKRPQGQKGSWCDDPACIRFEFDATHTVGPDVAAVGCEALGADPTPYCLGGLCLTPARWYRRREENTGPQKAQGRR